MTTLTKVAQITRRIIILILFLTVLGSFLYIILSSIKKTIISLRPPPPLYILTTFGKIPKVTFPQQNFPTEIKFTIEILSGEIPDASPTAKVYLFTKKQQGLLTNIRAIEDAQKLGFKDNPQNIEKKFLFKEEGKEFIIDPISRDFTYTYDYLSDGSVFEGENILTETTVVSTAINFLNKLSALPKDYETQNPKVTFLTFNGKQFVPTSPEEKNLKATCARVDFYRKEIENIRVVSKSDQESNISVIISKSKDPNKQVIKAKRLYKEISFENVGIYPIKKGNEAWEEFLNGKGYIVNPGNSNFTKRVVIRDAYLAYYDDPENLFYLMPVYVFVGDSGFMAYSNAVSEEWLQ